MSYGKRADGTEKGEGWLGPMKRGDGSVSTEISVGVPINGKEAEIPLMVPNLDHKELRFLLTTDPQDPMFFKMMPPTLMEKAYNHAMKRVTNGLSPFRGPKEGLVP